METVSLHSCGHRSYLTSPQGGYGGRPPKCNDLIWQLVEISGQTDEVNLSNLLFGAPVSTLNTFNILKHPLELEFKSVYGCDNKVEVWVDLITIPEKVRDRFNYYEVYVNQFEPCLKTSIDTMLPISAIYRLSGGHVHAVNEGTDLPLVPRFSCCHRLYQYFCHSVTPSDKPSTTLEPATLTNALPAGKYEFTIDTDMCNSPHVKVSPYILQYVTLLRIDNHRICCYQGLTEETLPPKEKLYRRCCQLYGAGDIASLNLELDNNRELAAEPLLRHGIPVPSVVVEPNWYGGYGTADIYSDLSLPAIMDLERWIPEGKKDLEDRLTRLYQKSKNSAYVAFNG